MAAWTSEDRVVLGKRLRALIASGTPPDPIVAGHPYPGQRYRHGWIPVGGGISLKTTPTGTRAGQREVHDELKTSDDPVLRQLDVSHWAGKLRRPHVITARDDKTGKVIGPSGPEGSSGTVNRRWRNGSRSRMADFQPEIVGTLPGLTDTEAAGTDTDPADR